MEIIKIQVYTSPSAPDGKAIFVYKTSDNWYWLRQLVDEEGFATPFASIKEIEVAIDMPLTLLKETSGKWPVPKPPESG